jgi:DNA-binding response OmpR family regulator
MRAVKENGAEVLIIEDDDDIGQSLSEMLTERGYGALAVRTGPKGLDLLGKGMVPRVIVLDPFTPNGWRSFRAAQHANPAWAAIPLLIGGGRPSEPVTPLTPGREHHLGRPLDVDELLQLVNRYCRPWG